MLPRQVTFPWPKSVVSVFCCTWPSSFLLSWFLFSLAASPGWLVVSVYVSFLPNHHFSEKSFVKFMKKMAQEMFRSLSLQFPPILLFKFFNIPGEWRRGIVGSFGYLNDPNRKLDETSGVYGSTCSPISPKTLGTPKPSTSDVLSDYFWDSRHSRESEPNLTRPKLFDISPLPATLLIKRSAIGWNISSLIAETRDFVFLSWER